MCRPSVRSYAPSGESTHPGNSYFAEGLPDPIPDTMSEGEVEHQHWTHAQLDPKKRAVLAQWPYSLTYDFEGTKVTFIHYGPAASGRDFTPTIRNATALELDSIFPADDVSLLFYGHNHGQSDIQGRARCLNPGSLGCFDQPVARYYMVDFRHGGYTLTHRSVSYDDGALLRAFDERQVPEREFILRMIFWWALLDNQLRLPVLARWAWPNTQGVHTEGRCRRREGCV